MKRILLSLIFTVGALMQAQAQNEKYVRAMEGAIGKLRYTASKEDLQEAANQFERISAVETSEWLPNYWAAYAYAMLAFNQTEAGQKDALLDKADNFYRKAVAQQPDNDELMVLQAYLAQTRMTVDPQNRWQQYGGIAQTALASAQKKNPDNPRTFLLRGQSLFFTPEQFGGGKAVAKPVLQQSAEKFATFKPISSIYPNWGSDTAKYFLSQCDGK
ncbi:hypothetical protein GCM10023187_18920 [Nibrella viscosa]|uniref:Tetratricopeptide repeat protein n=1 Tax=Nibrella viscosa TaxID=1084524 RepID=A0ABP8KAZ4_9BACT